MGEGESVNQKQNGIESGKKISSSLVYEMMYSLAIIPSSAIWHQYPFSFGDMAVVF